MNARGLEPGARSESSSPSRSQKPNEVMRELGRCIQWVHSYATQDRLFCVYLAKDEDLIHRHAEPTGFPATKVSEVNKIIDPRRRQPKTGALYVSKSFLATKARQLGKVGPMVHLT